MVLSGWVYLDTDHPVAAWAAYRGQLISVARPVDYVPGNISMMAAEMLRTNNGIRLENELLIEKVRAESFSHRVSRLTGLYFFESRDTADRAMAWGDYFHPKYLSEVEVDIEGIPTRADSQWISRAPLLSNGAIDRSDLTWIYSYWEGKPYNAHPMWEAIFTGRINVLSIPLRNRAYETAKTSFSDALALLEISRIAAASNSSIGRIVPRVERTGATQATLSYFVDRREAEDPLALERIRNYRGPRNWKDLEMDKATFNLPDLSDYKTDLSWEGA